MPIQQECALAGACAVQQHCCSCCFWTAARILCCNRHSLVSGQHHAVGAAPDSTLNTLQHARGNVVNLNLRLISQTDSRG